MAQNKNLKESRSEVEKSFLNILWGTDGGSLEAIRYLKTVLELYPDFVIQNIAKLDEQARKKLFCVDGTEAPLASKVEAIEILEQLKREYNSLSERHKVMIGSLKDYVVRKYSSGLRVSSPRDLLRFTELEMLNMVPGRGAFEFPSCRFNLMNSIDQIRKEFEYNVAIREAAKEILGPASDGKAAA